MPSALFEDMERAYEEASDLKFEVGQLRLVDRHNREALKLRTETASIAMERADDWKDRYETEHQRFKAASQDAREAAQRAWHESDVLWFSFGFIVAAGLVALSAWAYSQIDGKIQLVSVPAP